MILFPNAKINLGLNVVEKRPDGFHNIETIFLPVKLCDALEILPANEKTTFDSSGIVIPPDNNDNLCLRAFSLLQKEYKLPNIKIHLHKAIPVGAGLGGGSSDAAFTLKMLNELFELNIDYNKMIEFAAKLGSDCAFFIGNKPAVAKGRGELLREIDLELNGKYFVIVKPDLHVNTAYAYSLVKPAIPEKSIESIIKQPISTWKNELKNDFEFPIMSNHSVINDIKSELYSNGAVYASMSGSGSAVYAIFDAKPQKNLKAKFSNCFYWSGLI